MNLTLLSRAVVILMLWPAPSLFAQADDQAPASREERPLIASPQNAKPESEVDPLRPTPPSAVATYRFPAATERFHSYLKSTFGPGTILISGIDGGIAQKRKDPPEWGQGAEGFGRRFGSAEGQALISGTTVYGPGEVLHEDTAYHKCGCTGVFNRLGHVFKETYVSRTASGRMVPSLPAFVGPYVGAVSSVYGWYPDRFGWKDGVRIGTRILVSRPILIMMREFVP